MDLDLEAIKKHAQILYDLLMQDPDSGRFLELTCELGTALNSRPLKDIYNTPQKLGA